MKRFRRLLISGIVILLVCGGAGDGEGASSGGGRPPRPQEEWTAGPLEKQRPHEAGATLGAVRVGRHENFDRVVFEFKGAAAPGYHIAYVGRRVRACGSGNAVRVAGVGRLEVRLSPAQAHTESGRPTVGQREMRLRLPVIRELQSTCDFEGDVTWVVGVASPNRFRVLELSNPARLVVDIRHARG